MTALHASLAMHGFLRHPRPTPKDHREWLHFHVRGGDADLIVNASITGDARVDGSRVRLLVLARDAHGWHGDLDDVADAELRGGQLHLCADAIAITREGEAIRISGELAKVAFDVMLEPRTFSSIARDVAVPGGSPINWLVVPRLAASGTIAIDGRATRFADAIAYHDHNWGTFSHRDFTWRWGHAHGKHDSVVVSSLLDRAQSTCFLQTLMLWRGPRIARIFRGDEVTMRPHGYLRPPSALVVPRFATLLASGASEVPQRLDIEAAADGDRLAGSFTAVDLARIVVPELDGLRTTVIHEIVGDLSLHGHVHGEPVSIEARAAFELLRGVQ